MRFSQRIGETPTTKEIQLKSIDEDLKNGLWNIYQLFVLERIQTGYSFEVQDTPVFYFGRSLWHNHFKKRIDEMPNSASGIKSKIRLHFVTSSWHSVYDLLEESLSIIKQSPRYFEGISVKDLYKHFNQVLEREYAGYRFVNGKLSPITNPTEQKEIEEALSLTNKFTLLKGADTHLREALAKISDRQNPDYRNSIKESISAVEAVAKVISGDTKDKLGEALNKIKDKVPMHNALVAGYKSIYGYSSDSSGIRHAITDDTTCDFEDAKYMLVSCSAFVNYLITKATKAGISFS